MQRTVYKEDLCFYSRFGGPNFIELREATGYVKQIN